MDIPLTDAHCHADIGKFSDRKADLSGMDICASSCFAGEWDELQNFSLFPIKKAFGIHPDLRISEKDDIRDVEKEVFPSYLGELEKKLSSRADAVGEAGLDSRVLERVPRGLQMKIFAAQLELARGFALPIIVHCVGAWGALFDILKSEVEKNGNLRFLIHAAGCSREMAYEFQKIGAYFSFGKRELANERICETIKALDVHRILSESDSVDTSKDLIFSAVKKISEIRSESVSNTADMIEENFKTFFAR